MDSAELAAVANKASHFLKTIAHPVRLQILCMLVQEEMTVTNLINATGIRQSTVSQHLSRLRREGFVTNRRTAKELRYSLISDGAQEVITLLHCFFCSQGKPSANALSDGAD